MMRPVSLLVTLLLLPALAHAAGPAEADLVVTRALRSTGTEPWQGAAFPVTVWEIDVTNEGNVPAEDFTFTFDQRTANLANHQTDHAQALIPPGGTHTFTVTIHVAPFLESCVTVTSATAESDTSDNTRCADLGTPATLP